MNIDTERRREMMRHYEKHNGKFIPQEHHQVSCPTCGADAYEPCFDMRTVDLKTQYVAKTHSTRTQLCKESILCHTLAQYQMNALRTASHTDNRDLDISVLALGLTGESGEVADLIKKHVGHGHKLSTQEIKEELGDVLWYVAILANRLGVSLQDVAISNVRKLRKRYPSGFTSKDSINRGA